MRIIAVESIAPHGKAPLWIGISAQSRGLPMAVNWSRCVRAENEIRDITGSIFSRLSTRALISICVGMISLDRVENAVVLTTAGMGTGQYFGNGRTVLTEVCILHPPRTSAGRMNQVYAPAMSIGRSFHVLLGANAASNLADGLAFVSIPLVAASLTSDPRLIAGLATIYALVRLFVALPIGVWVDRSDRRTLLAAANLLRGAAVIALALCLLVGVEGLVLLYVAFGILGTLESAADNAAMSLVPSYVHEGDLDRANGRISATQLVADEFIGPPLGGLLFAVAATAPVFMMGGLWAVAGFLALALPRTLKRPATTANPSAAGAFWTEAFDGLRWIAHNRVVGALALIGALASIGYMLPFSILVLFAEDQLGVNPTQYGLILAASALGGLIGSFLTSRVRSRFGYRVTIAASLLTGAVSLFALALTTEPILAAILLALYILHAVAWGICAASLRQRLVPEDLRGRVSAGSRVLGLLGLAIGSFVGGALATIDPGLAVAAGGMVFVACAVLALVLIRTTDVQTAGPVGTAGHFLPAARHRK